MVVVLKLDWLVCNGANGCKLGFSVQVHCVMYSGVQVYVCTCVFVYYSDFVVT